MTKVPTAPTEPQTGDMAFVKPEGFSSSRISSESWKIQNFVISASKAVRRLLWLADADSLEKVRIEAECVKSALKSESEARNRFSKESCERSNSTCESCWATGNLIVNKIGKRTSTESVRTWTRMRLVTIVKGIPIYAPEDTFEDRDRTDPLQIRHCNACGNEWERRSPHYETERWALEDYLDYVRYSAAATANGQSDSHWLTEQAVDRLKSKSGWKLPYRETIAILSKESRYDKFDMKDKRWLRKFLLSVLDGQS